MISKHKKLISLLLAMCVLCSLSVSAFATTDYTNGTTVTYVGQGAESYTITVPANLLPGTGGTVTLQGKWAANRIVTVTADSSVELVNSINANDKKTLTVTFDGISEAGDNTEELTFTETVSVSNIQNALFGTWSGKFNYNVEVGDSEINELVLEGDGQTFHKMAPSTLSFRSPAPLDEFQTVLINGEPLDESAYTLTEGSTIVTLNIDYLETLNVADYEITVVSDSGSPSAGFDVVEPIVNNYGFYYNQPYTTYFDDLSQDIVFFIREDGTMDVMFISIAMEIVNCTYTLNDTEMVVHMPDGTDYHCDLLVDEQAIYCEELNEKAKIDAEKVAYDDEYLYFYSDFNGGYVARAMDKSKTTYKPIKTNILGVNIVSLEGAFYDCVNMIEAPKIPEKVTFIGDAYGGCSSLISAPVIPNGVTGMIATFSGCTSLTTAPIIPENVVDLSSTFANCSNLTGDIVINTSKIGTTSDSSNCGCFSGTKLPIRITGNCSDGIKAALANTAENGNVTY